MTDVYVQPGGEKYERWAKNKLTALGQIRADVGLPIMRKHYVPESGVRVDIESSDFGDRIRIWASGISYTLPLTFLNPIPYRGIRIDETGSYVPVIAYIRNIGPSSDPAHDSGFALGTLEGGYLYPDGSRVVVGTWDCPFSGNPYSFTGALTINGMEGAVIPFGSGTPVFSNTPAWTGISLVDGYEIAIGLGIALESRRVVVSTSDQITLASEAQTKRLPSPIFVRYSPELPWNGADFVRMLDNEAGVITFNHNLVFTTPPDLIYPDPGLGTELPLRRKAWNKANTDTVVARLRAGTLDLTSTADTGLASWDALIKANAIQTRHADVAAARRVTSVITNTIVSDTTAGLTTAGVQVTRRDVTLSYDHNDTHFTQDFTGTTTITIAPYTLISSGTPHFVRTTVYDNWYQFGGYLPVTHASHGVGTFMSGTLIQDIGNPNSTYGAPIGGLDLYSPTLPANTDTRRYEIPEFLQTYHRTVRPTYDKTVFTAFGPLFAWSTGMSITIIPVGLVKAGDSLGMFPDATDAVGADGIEVYGRARYSYDYINDKFTFRSWTPLRDADGNEVASRQAALGGTYRNALVVYTDPKWQDIIDAAKAANEAQKDPADPDYDPFVAVVLDAIQ